MTTDPVSYDGKHYSVRDIHVLRSRCSGAASRLDRRPHRRRVWRAGTIGDGWHPIAMRPPAMLNPDEYAAKVQEIHGWARRAGRDPKSIALTIRVPMEVRGRNAKAAAGDRPPFQGTADEIADDIRRYQALGVSHFVFDHTVQELRAVLANIERFASDVRPKLTRAGGGRAASVVARRGRTSSKKRAARRQSRSRTRRHARSSIPPRRWPAARRAGELHDRAGAARHLLGPGLRAADDAVRLLRLLHRSTRSGEASAPVAPDEVVALTQAGSRLGAKALFSLGDRPEVFASHREFLRRHGHRTTLSRLRAVCAAGPGGVASSAARQPRRDGRARPGALREVNVSMGIMPRRYQSAPGRGMAHDRAPTGATRRLKTIALAGKLGIPFTTGYSSASARRVASAWTPVPSATSQRHGHIQRSSSRTSGPNRGSRCGRAGSLEDSCGPRGGTARPRPDVNIRRRTSRPTSIRGSWPRGQRLGRLSPLTLDHINPGDRGRGSELRRDRDPVRPARASAIIRSSRRAQYLDESLRARPGPGRRARPRRGIP